jgi:hypothetical protein
VEVSLFGPLFSTDEPSISLGFPMKCFVSNVEVSTSLIKLLKSRDHRLFVSFDDMDITDKNAPGTNLFGVCGEAFDVLLFCHLFDGMSEVWMIHCCECFVIAIEVIRKFFPACSPCTDELLEVACISS